MPSCRCSVFSVWIRHASACNNWHFQWIGWMGPRVVFHAINRAADNRQRLVDAFYFGSGKSIQHILGRTFRIPCDQGRFQKIIIHVIQNCFFDMVKLLDHQALWKRYMHFPCALSDLIRLLY
ncbi:hypothetical protein FLCH110379_00180 [Flavobacterium chungbukense]